jgi:hypothetical protein
MNSEHAVHTKLTKLITYYASIIEYIYCRFLSHVSSIRFLHCTFAEKSCRKFLRAFSIVYTTIKNASASVTWPKSPYALTNLNEKIFKRCFNTDKRSTSCKIRRNLTMSRLKTNEYHFIDVAY